MNLFRSEEHAKRWSLYYRGVDDYVMPVADWGTVLSASMFRKRLDSDYLAHSADYLEDYRQALRAMGKAIPAADRVLSTVMFTDIVDSTKVMSSIGDTAWSELLERHHEVVRSELSRWRGQEVDTTGDGFFATFDGTARAVNAAHAIVQSLRPLGIDVRIGLHTGEVELVDGKAAGTAVHIGARVSSLAGPGEVLVSRTVKETITGSGIGFEDRGTHQLKGVSGHWQLYAAVL
jgi:class 3 adenylate cyclase